MDPVVANLIPDHEQVEVFHPKACNEVPAYLKTAAEKELKRMLEGGLLEETCFTWFLRPKTYSTRGASKSPPCGEL